MALEITIKLESTEELRALEFALDIAFDLEDARYEDELNDKYSPADKAEMRETYARLMALRALVVRITGNHEYDRPRKPEEFAKDH